jgi:acyl-CoA reductase-like NAD-dependent aldehyde dehydrogenase
VGAAVAAARRALNGPWSLLSTLSTRLLFRLADLVEARADELALIDTLDYGKPMPDARMDDTRVFCFSLRSPLAVV